MVKLQSFSIEFESPYGVCHAGQPVVGAVCIQLSDSTNVTGKWHTYMLCNRSIVQAQQAPYRSVLGCIFFLVQPCVIYPLTMSMPYCVALQYAQLPSLLDRRDKFCQDFFSANCLIHLIAFFTCSHPLVTLKSRLSLEEQPPILDLHTDPIATLTFKALLTCRPPYLSDLSNITNPWDLCAYPILISFRSPITTCLLDLMLFGFLLSVWNYYLLSSAYLSHFLLSDVI